MSYVDYVYGRGGSIVEGKRWPSESLDPMMLQCDGSFVKRDGILYDPFRLCVTVCIHLYGERERRPSLCMFMSYDLLSCMVVYYFIS